VTAETRVRMATEVMACYWRKIRGIGRRKKEEERERK
jgi:hypothetical protein